MNAALSHRVDSFLRVMHFALAFRATFRYQIVNAALSHRVDFLLRIECGLPLRAGLRYHTVIAALSHRVDATPWVVNVALTFRVTPQ